MSYPVFQRSLVFDEIHTAAIVTAILNGLNGARRSPGASRLNVLKDHHHSPHCRACKVRVAEMLKALHGECLSNHQFPWPTRPGDYTGTALGDLLEQIRIALANFRGHREFIKSALMPPCDYFVPDPPFILEFDESQHFSAARLVTLSHYPAAMKFGFSLERWRALCHQINAKDDAPLDRDERRAWYDLLRDMLPNLHGFQPTRRLYSGALAWCHLDHQSGADRQYFKRVLNALGPGQSA